MKILAAFSIVCGLCYSFDFRYLQLPENNIRRLFFINETLRKICIEQGPDEEKGCPYYSLAESPRCWGFEKGCKEKDIEKIQRRIKCSNPDDVATFWRQADFGYATEHLSTFTECCKPRNPGEIGQSSLSCNAHVQFCTGKNIVIDFRKMTELPSSNKMYRKDLIKGDTILGNCELDWSVIPKEHKRKGFLTSWKRELLRFTATTEPVFNETDPRPDCDLVVDKTAFIMKMDAGINMFHHYCDFINLYVTQVMLGILDKDILIVNWNTDASRKYIDPFHMTWEAFTWHQPVEIGELAHKRVCFKNVVFPLPPRMFYGLYYNMPLVKGCSRSSLFKSFHDFLAHRLNLTQSGPLKGTVRVVLLNRKTAHRNIKNADELLEAANKIDGVLATQITYSTKMPFVEQVNNTLNADVFIGMHGAGLTHALFLPDWAVLFELFNCGDENCYKDLANERGVHYMTWEKKDLLKKHGKKKHPRTGEEHEKFLDYIFDVEEFSRLVKKAAAYVREHPAYLNSLRVKKKELLLNEIHDEL